MLEKKISFCLSSQHRSSEFYVMSFYSESFGKEMVIKADCIEKLDAQIDLLMRGEEIRNEEIRQPKKSGKRSKQEEEIADEDLL
jgi:hypothetical protein